MNTFIEILKVLAWPVVTLLLALGFRQTINGLVPGAKIKFKLAGIEVETTLNELTTVIQETYRHGELTKAQWSWLTRLSDERKIAYNHQEHYEDLRPLRNSGFIREHPEGWLSNCEHITITPLGEFLLKNINT